MQIQKLITEDMLLVLPDGYDKTKTYPLFIHLHGVGGRAGLDSLIAGELPTEVQKAADRFGIIVIAPHTAGGWEFSHTDKAIAYAKANLSINWTKVYYGGLSLGGDGVTKYLSYSLANCQQFSAVAVSCGVNSLATGIYINQAQLPCVFFHAKDDATVSVQNSRDAVNRINATNPVIKAKLVEYENGQHWIWNKVFNSTERPWIGNESPATLWDWFLINTADKPVEVPIATTPTGLTAKAASTIKDGMIYLDGTGSTGYESVAWTDKSAVKSTWVGGTGYKTAISKPPASGTYVFELKVGKSGVYVTDTITVVYQSGTTTPTKTVASWSTVFRVITFTDGTTEPLVDEITGADKSVTLKTASNTYKL